MVPSFAWAKDTAASSDNEEVEEEEVAIDGSGSDGSHTNASTSSAAMYRGALALESSIRKIEAAEVLIEKVRNG